MPGFHWKPVGRQARGLRDNLINDGNALYLYDSANRLY